SGGSQRREAGHSHGHRHLPHCIISATAASRARQKAVIQIFGSIVGSAMGLQPPSRPCSGWGPLPGGPTRGLVRFRAEEATQKATTSTGEHLCPPPMSTS